MDQLTHQQEIDVSIIQCLVGGSRAQVKDWILTNPNCEGNNWGEHLSVLKLFIQDKIKSKIQGAT